MTQDDINALARSLNITPETCPQVWDAPLGQYTCTLPSPLSDDPAADFWVGPMMRKLGWPHIMPDVNRGFILKLPWWKIREETPAAALYAAIKAGEE